MVFGLFSLLYVAFERLVQSVFTTIFYFCLAIAAGHYFGWVERWIWFVIEKEASKIVNGAKVTVGSFRLDWSAILQGKITAEVSNAILHTPQRAVWGWESPLIGRVGFAKVEVNAPITIFHELILRRRLPLEIYSVYVTDVQVFVERHDQVINVYLCDPAAVLPPPPYLNPLSLEGGAISELGRSQSEPLMEASRSEATEELFREHHGETLETVLSGENRTEKQKVQAQKLVQDMLQTVQSLGRAAQTGSLPSAVKKHGLEIAEMMRDGLSTRNRNTSELEQGVALMEQVGKVAVESLKTPQLILPERNVKPGGPVPPMARVGRILLKDIRIFTKDSWIEITKDENNENRTKLKHHTGAFGTDSNDKDDDEPPVRKANWNRPIHIAKMVVRASELCPPMSAKDEDNPDFPAVYQRIDKIVEIVWRRLLAEMAKSNGGRLFSTAIGEVLSFIKSNPQQPKKMKGAASTTPPTTSTPNRTRAVKKSETSKGDLSKVLRSPVDGSKTAETVNSVDGTSEVHV